MIKTVQFASNQNSTLRNNIEIAQPSKDGGSLTVLCGKNHSGKTYIVKRVHRSISQRNKEIEINPEIIITRHAVDNIYTEYSVDSNPINSVFVTRIANITELLKSVSIISDNNYKSRKYLQRSDNYDRIQIKECLEIFCFECLDYLFKRNSKNLKKEKWKKPENIEYRKVILDSLSRESLYLTPRDNQIIKSFEEITQGKVYFGISDSQSSIGVMPVFELRLAFNDEIIIPLGGWSEGQKVLFSLLILIYYAKPDVLIFDEIENHLHPEYISLLFEFIKKNVPQTIITTHHPHIIFSRFVDMVNYLEFEKSSDSLPDIIEKKRSAKMKSLKQTNVILSKNYSKLISTYKLFDSYDNQLLRIASSNIADLNELLVDIFTSLFNYEIVSPKKIKKPDVQSQKLYEIFEKKLLEQNLNVLEYGAGEGRLLIDIDKIVKTTHKDKIFWNLFEPFDTPRLALEENLNTHAYRDLIKIFKERPIDKFDFIIIPNVLHELTPKTIANILSYCSNSLKDDGSIIIVELFPLLKPEKFAVPLRSTEWTDLTRKIGFKSFSNGINFKNAIHEAYFTQLYLPDDFSGFDELRIEKVIKNYWNKIILKERSLNYSGSIRFGDSDEIPLTLGTLSTIASIIAYGNGSWKT